MCIVGDNSLVIHDHNRQVNIYSYNQNNGHWNAKTVDVTVGYQDPQCEQKFILMINQAISIDGLNNPLLCLIQCHLNGVLIIEVPKFLAERPTVTTHAIELTDLIDASHSLIVPLQLSCMTSYFDVHSPSIAEYDSFHCWEPSRDPSTNEYSEKETQMIDHWGQISISVSAARCLLYKFGRIWEWRQY